MPARKPPIPVLGDVDCTSYRPGHGVHWIQALHTANKPEVRAESWTGRIIELASDGLTVERVDGTRVRYLNHHMERLEALSGGIGGTVVVSGEYSILRCGIFCFSIAVDHGQPLDACIPKRPIETSTVSPKSGSSHAPVTA